MFHQFISPAWLRAISAEYAAQPVSRRADGQKSTTDATA